MPKDEASDSREFYQELYSEGFTTDCPADEALSRLVANSFSGSEKDFQGYVAVLKALGLEEGDSLMDFGSSWGYGSWQFRQSGFRVVSYEISRPRAEYAKTKLSCDMVESLDDMPERVKCLFSAHVIEHLPNPNVIWEVATKVLTNDGIIVCFCPNGEPARESVKGPESYDKAWGKVHPMLITPKFLQNMSARFGFRAHLYSSPYRADRISDGSIEAEVTGDELCLVARRN
jgi:cyclopropane fatty-acyl-phospholipid synthase-like methyltransferase